MSPTRAPSLRRDSLRPRTNSTDATKQTLLTALNLLILALGALHKLGETPSNPTFATAHPSRAATISALYAFVRDAWTEETFTSEVRKAQDELPMVGIERYVGMWLSEAVRVLRDGGCKGDAEDLEGVALGLRGKGVKATGGGLGERRDPRADGVKAKVEGKKVSKGPTAEGPVCD